MRPVSSLPSSEEVREILAYDPETGVFTWRVRRGGRSYVGSIAGHTSRLGYIRIYLFGRSYQAQRIAWLLTYGQWPTKYIDHINGKPSDNRICNLREASPAENSRNCALRFDSKSGFKGVNWDKECRKWKAQIRVQGKKIYLGLFETAEAAHAAYCAAAIERHGEFARLR